MTEQSPEMPFEVLDAAAEHFHVNKLQDDLARKDALLTNIASETLAELTEHPAHLAMQAADRLHHAARERLETGHLPSDTIDDAVALATKHRHAKRSFVERVEAKQDSNRGIG